MKRTWKKVLAFVCAFTLVAVPITYNIVNADGSDSDSIARFFGASDASSSSAAAENAATEEEYFEDEWAADEDASTGTEYMLTIPSTLTVKNSGWNEIEGGIAATGTLEAGKKLVVTAESENSWALKSGDNSVGYNLAANGNSESVYNKESNPASWEFESLSSGTAATKKAGIIVEDYSEKPAGDYEDVVTFTASLADVLVKSVTINELTKSIIVGDTGTFTASVLPENAVNKNVSWSSDNTDVLTIDSETGVFKAKSEGTAKVKATARDGSSKSAEYSVTVKQLATKLTLIGEAEDYGKTAVSLNIDFDENSTWQDMVDKYDELIADPSTLGPDGYIIRLKNANTDDKYNSYEVKHSDSSHKYKLVSINDKVTDYEVSFIGCGHGLEDKGKGYFTQP